MKTEDAPKPKKIPAQSTQTTDKAALLQEFLEAALGRRTVRSKKLKSLTDATKDMLNRDRTIKASILKSLPKDQRETLVKLAAERAQEMD